MYQAHRIRKAAYSLYFDLGYNAMQIQREVCSTFSIRTVKRMIKEFEETFTWQPKKAASRAAQRVLCSKSLDALSEMLTGDPTLYLSQLKKALWDDYGVKVSITHYTKRRRRSGCHFLSHTYTLHKNSKTKFLGQFK